MMQSMAHTEAMATGAVASSLTGETGVTQKHRLEPAEHVSRAIMGVSALFGIWGIACLASGLCDCASSFSFAALLRAALIGF